MGLPPGQPDGGIFLIAEGLSVCHVLGARDLMVSRPDLVSPVTGPGVAWPPTATGGGKEENRAVGVCPKSPVRLFQRTRNRF